jgi:hypothetical protein
MYGLWFEFHPQIVFLRRWNVREQLCLGVARFSSFVCKASPVSLPARHTPCAQ